MNRIKGILYAAVSSSTFGLAPFFSITLLLAGFSAFEVLSYRWGVAAIVLTLFGWCSGCNFRLAKKDLLVVFFIKFVAGNHLIQFAHCGHPDGKGSPCRVGRTVQGVSGRGGSQ